jgi:hypothetical protein
MRKSNIAILQRSSDTRGLEDPQTKSKNRKQLKKALGKVYFTKWKEKWAREKRGRTIYSLRQYPDQKSLDLYTDRSKAISSITIQLRSQKIGLQGFLHHQKVPGIENPLCPFCQHEDESVKHFLLKCTQWNTQRVLYLGPYSDKRLDIVLGTKEGTIRAARFLIVYRSWWGLFLLFVFARLPP